MRQLRLMDIRLLQSRLLLACSAANSAPPLIKVVWNQMIMAISNEIDMGTTAGLSAVYTSTP